MFDDIKEYIYNDLRENNMSKTELAKELGFNPTYFINVLNGMQEISKRMLECIADHYDMAFVYSKGKYKLIREIKQ